MKKKNTAISSSSSKIETWLQEKSNILFYALLAIYILFSLLYFNVKPSIAGDDSSYIIRAINFIESGKFPTYQGPIYPLFLSLIIAISGMNLVILKLSSTLFMVGFVIIFYKSFKNKISYISLFYTISILSVSSLFLFFSSQTFSEALFLLLQACLFYILFKEINNKQSTWIPSKKEIIFLALTSLLCALLFLTRTIGFGALLAIITFFTFQRNFKRVIYITAFFAFILTLFFSVRSVAWDVPLKSGDQSSQLMNKNPYDKNQGTEDFKGFITRFKDNSNLYLSKHLMRIIGFRSAKINTIIPPISIALYLVFIIGFILYFRNNKFLFFTSIYLAIMLGITFFSLQKIWDQYRLIIPFIPLILIVLSESILSFGKEKKLSFINSILPFILLLSIALTLSKGIKTIDTTTLSKNLRGDKLAGYTPDWISYLKMAEYCNSELSKDNLVACRKPNMARIYGKGKKFHGIYRIPSNSCEELIQYLKDRNVSHIILASLRKNPYAYTGQTINTIQRFMGTIVKKHPQAFKLIKKYGNQEPAYLFEINYAILQSEKEKK